MPGAVGQVRDCGDMLKFSKSALDHSEKGAKALGAGRGSRLPCKPAGFGLLLHRAHGDSRGLHRERGSASVGESSLCFARNRSPCSRPGPGWSLQVARERWVDMGYTSAGVTLGLTCEVGPSLDPQRGCECVPWSTHFVLAVALRGAPRDLAVEKLPQGSETSERLPEDTLWDAAECGLTLPSVPISCLPPGKDSEGCRARRWPGWSAPHDASGEGADSKTRSREHEEGRSGGGRRPPRRSLQSPLVREEFLNMVRLGQPTHRQRGTEASLSQLRPAGVDWGRVWGWAPQGHIVNPDGGPESTPVPPFAPAAGSSTRTTHVARGHFLPRNNRDGRNRWEGCGDP